MGWKKWSYWLKGGIIALGLDIIYAASGLLALENFGWIVTFVIAPAAAIPLFLIGAIIGWIVGKIKSK